MRNAHLHHLSILLALFVFITGCDDDSSSATFDVLVSVDKVIDMRQQPLHFLPRAMVLRIEYTYLWRFGDGQESDEENPSHRYEQPGEYKVTLELSESGGASGQGELVVA